MQFISHLFLKWKCMNKTVNTTNSTPVHAPLFAKLKNVCTSGGHWDKLQCESEGLFMALALKVAVNFLLSSFGKIKEFCSCESPTHARNYTEKDHVTSLIWLWSLVFHLLLTGRPFSWAWWPHCSSDDMRPMVTSPPPWGFSLGSVLSISLCWSFVMLLMSLKWIPQGGVLGAFSLSLSLVVVFRSVLLISRSGYQLKVILTTLKGNGLWGFLGPCSDVEAR